MLNPHKVYMIMTDRGEILLAEVEGCSNEMIGDRVLLRTPALVAHERTPNGVLGFMLSAWIPHELLKTPNIVLEANRIVGVMSPTPELVSFYNVWAETERDKLQHFNKDFKMQVAAIEKDHINRYEARKEHRKRKEIFVHSHSLPDTIIRLFEEDNDWGNPSTTN